MRIKTVTKPLPLKSRPQIMTLEDYPCCHESVAADGAPIGAQTIKLCSIYFFVIRRTFQGQNCNFVVLTGKLQSWSSNFCTLQSSPRRLPIHKSVTNLSRNYNSVTKLFIISELSLSFWGLQFGHKTFRVCNLVTLRQPPAPATTSPPARLRRLETQISARLQTCWNARFRHRNLPNRLSSIPSPFHHRMWTRNLPKLR
ncbi:hypothetical protein LINGRAHAP2_LOCUS23780 [Linum grandiflorum]